MASGARHYGVTILARLSGPLSKPPVRLALALAAGALLALAAAGCGGGSKSATSATSHRSPFESIFGADVALRTNPTGTLDLLRSLGVTRVKVMLPWSHVAPAAQASSPPAGFRATDPAAYPTSGWAPYDAIMRAAHTRGVGVDLTVVQPAPQWATGAGAPSGPSGIWKPSATAFGAFMRAVGTRYSGHYKPAGGGSPLPRVDFWGVWNEPNYGQDLAPQAIGSTIEIAPRLYRGLLDAAYASLQATGHGQDTILIGDIAPRGITVGDAPGNFSGMVPLRFVRALYCVGSHLTPLRGSAATLRGCPATAAASRAFPAQHPVLFRASGFAVHPYPQGRTPPNLPNSFEPDYADLGALVNLEHLLDRVLTGYGSSKRFDLWSTEFGYKTDPPYASGLPLSTAALYLNWSEYISWSNPRIRSYDQYLITDPAPNSGSSFDTGLEYASGAPKPTLAAFRLPLFLPRAHAGRGHAIEVWGCIRPAPYAQRDTGSQQTAQVEFARTPAGPFTVLDHVPITDPDGYFDVQVKFPASGVVRLSWTPPHGPVQHSRMATVAIG